MRRVAAVALLIGLGTGMAWAQRGGGARGGFGGGFSARGAGGFGAAGRVSAPALLGRGYAAPALRAPGATYYRRSYGGPERFRVPYIPAALAGYGLGYGLGLPYPYEGLGWDYPYSYADSYGDTSAAQAYGPVDAGAGQAPYYPGGYGPGPNAGGAAPPVEEARNVPAGGAESAPEPEDAVTLIFKDGRPPEQIHNYMLTRTTLYVRDGRRQEIPVDELDLAATAKVNKAAGVDFALPVVAK